MRIGSNEHKVLFCGSFLSTHLEYDPQTLEWPELSELHLTRLRSIPFWRTALAVEQNAGAMVSAFATLVEDPLIRRTVALQGEEESRHARLVEKIIDHYAIPVQKPPPPKPRITRQAFVDFGYEECLDAFFGFGLFGLARELQFFSPALLDVIQPLLVEETRHIVFFTNWIAYERARSGRGTAPMVAALTGIGYLRALARTVATVYGGRKDGTGFVAGGATEMVEGLTLRRFLSSCAEENERFMTQIDPRLLRPQLVPRIAAFIGRFVPRDSGASRAPRSLRSDAETG